MRQTVSIAVLLTMFVACGQKETNVASTTPSTAQPASATQAKATLTPEQLGELGAQLTRQPDRSNELLTHHGLTPETFEKEIRKVTQDPEASRRYAAAYKRASA